MIWSYSAAKMFRQCQLQWFLKTKVANAKAKDPFRREAYLLSKLQSLWAWRGQVVDQLLGTEIIKALYYRHPIHLDNLLHKARTSFALQVDFARRHRIREPGMAPAKVGAAFAAWHAIEYVEPITEADIEMAWRDVELALRNLCAMTELWDLLWTASRCIAQRPLQFESFGVKVKAIPDLIAFYADAPPLIIDWKVHTKGSYGSRSQLALYALALARCHPHKDFPSPSRIGDPTEMRLLEVQLLTGQQRFYRLCGEDIAAVEDFIGARADEMLLADHVKKSFVGQARAALEAVAAFGVQPGSGVVMLHRTYDRVHRQEDQLAAAVVRELFENHQLRVGVMHCDTVRECYREVVQSDGQRQYDPDPSQRGRLSGYLRNVALNKILLINRKWPFVKADRLHADITIGIDVKNNTCGLLVVGRFGADIRPFLKTSRQKEQLQPSQVKKYLCEVLREEASATSEPIRTIVIHRDGTLWPSELEGVQQAIAELKQEGVIPLDATLTVLEIAKSSPAPLRLYGVTEGSNSRPWIENAEVWDRYIVDDTEAYLCTTGQPFLRQGTARPLHVKRVAGSLLLLHCLEDLCALTVLAWTQPEGCSR